MVSTIVATMVGLALVNLVLGFATAVLLRRCRKRWGSAALGGTAGLPTPVPLAGETPPALVSASHGESSQGSETSSMAPGTDLAAHLGEQGAALPHAMEASVLAGYASGVQDEGAASSGPAPQPAGTEVGSGTGPTATDPPNSPQYSASAVPAAPEAIAVPTMLGPEQPPATPAGWAQGVRALEESSRQYQAQLAAIDQRLQSMQPQDTQEVLGAAASIRDAGQRYLHEQKEAAQGVLGESIPPDELADLAAQIRGVLEAQNAQIEASDRTLAALGSTPSPEEAHARCVAESEKLREASGRVGDMLGSALARLTVGAELPPAPAPDYEPLPPGLIARTAVEQKIAKWWKEDPERQRPLALAVLEIDLFEQLNGRFGRDVANRLLRAVTGIVLAEGGGHALASRGAGPRFAMAFPDADVRLAIHVVERIRQAIERAHFRCHEFDLRTTLSAGITPASPQDTLESLWQRAESALAEARRYGRNRVFVHEGRYPTPVVPPNLDLPEKSIDL